MNREKRLFEFTHAEFPFDAMKPGAYTLDKIPIAETGEIYLRASKDITADLAHTSLKIMVQEANSLMPQGGVIFSRVDEKPLQLLHSSYGFRPVFNEGFSDDSVSLTLEDRIQKGSGDLLLRFSPSFDSDNVAIYDGAASFFKIAGRFLMKRMSGSQ